VDNRDDVNWDGDKRWKEGDYDKYRHRTRFPPLESLGRVSLLIVVEQSIGRAVAHRMMWPVQPKQDQIKI
jgi:hypothetical protein